MKIPDEILASYKRDPETELFMKYFNEPTGKVLEIGSHDYPLAIILAKAGFNVTGIDLRPYDCGSHDNYSHHVFNFNKIPESFMKEHMGTFDCVVSVSTLEHFGLSAYQDIGYHPYADIAAAVLIWQLLKPGGSFILTVPSAGRYSEHKPHWKVYSINEIIHRFGYNMQLREIYFECVEAFEGFGKKFKIGDPVDLLSLSLNLTEFPGMSCYAKFVKQP